jgi:uracil-DNA glycosylase
MLEKTKRLYQYPKNNFIYFDVSFALLDKVWQEFLLANCDTQLSYIDAKLYELAQTYIIYPPPELTFHALEICKLSEIKVVIIGQDPYHGENEANGLAFAVNSLIKLPPSLKNIYKEVSNEYNLNHDVDGSHLLNWANQGVLLLNSCLTVIKDKAGSLSNIGWHYISDLIISQISKINTGVVFMLWGRHAQQKTRLIDTAKHKILLAPHPSPLSVYRGFYGCNHFLLANQYLQSMGKPPIIWGW